VISFKDSGTFLVRAIATTDFSGCKDTVLQQVNVESRVSSITLEKIFLMQPGNLLVYRNNFYPNNTAKKYQWGYDSILTRSPALVFGPSRKIPDQVNQFLVPEPGLDTVNKMYWVQLTDEKGCQSRVYYNGPFVLGRMQVPPPVSSVVQMQVVPNPNSGVFEMVLSGNIYGRVEAMVYNSLGRIVYQKSFIKNLPAIKENFLSGHLPAGLYFLELQSSDLKKVISRFVIQR
jgi:hypothetical protein